MKKVQKIMQLIWVFSSTMIAEAAEESTYDRIWGYATLYENKESGFLKKFALTGRAQYDIGTYDANQGNLDGSRWRRWRFGFKSEFVEDWGLHVEGDFDRNEGLGQGYERLTDAYISWKPDKLTTVKFLKQSAGFTLDGYTSSKKLYTLERNNLTNNLWFTKEYFTGITVKRDFNTQCFYKVGLFASDDSTEIEINDASYFLLASVEHTLNMGPKFDEATIHLDYVYNDKDVNANTPDLSHVASLSTRWQMDSFYLYTDLAAGHGYYNQKNLWGVVLMPFYDVSEMVQVIGRYTYLSSGENGVKLNRYEKYIVEGRGDKYNEIYAGLNIFFYGHKLKWQTGIQYTDMNDKANDEGEYQGWGLTTGLRFSY
ncbi:MAG: porin [Campylobacterota bacterium]|nr:porin [Campylobacterota bacterium]